ncbi:MAG TPA: peptide transporter [Armatimonadetes bacterium]|nr:peptide transporter [Armatimonadota bacterium]
MPSAPEPSRADDLAGEPFREGFNRKTILAALFIGFVMLPGAIYMGLVTGQSIGGAAQWVTIILFVEIARRSLVRLSRQEIYIIYAVASGLAAQAVPGLALYGGVFAVKIWDQFLVQSPQAEAFGLAERIPSWVVPPRGSPALMERTFLHSAWVVPILVLLAHQVLFRLNFFGLGYFLFRSTRDKERLPYPMAPVAVGGATALAESEVREESWRWQVFTVGAMIGLAYGFFYAAIPVFTGLWMAKPLQIIPIPFIDGSPKLGTVLPASTFGLLTDLGNFLVGFVLPFWVVVGQFLSSLGVNLVANPILYHRGLLPHWQPNSSVIQATISNRLDFWLSVSIGVGVVVALIGIGTIIVLSRRVSPEGQPRLTSKERRLEKERGDFPLWLALGLWMFSTLSYVWLCHTLVPEFPVWFFVLFGFGFTPLLSYISARMFGITGVVTGVSFPMVIEGSYLLSGYKGVDIWFAPVPYFDHGWVTQVFAELELCRVKFTSWIKAELTVFVILVVCSFLFWSIVWGMGPIPSSAYPFVQRMWPLFATMRSLWATSTLEGGSRWMLQALKPALMLYGGLVGLGLFAVISLLRWPQALFYGIVGGLHMWPHHVIPQLAGALLGRWYFAPKFGPDTWRRYAPILLAGYGCGMGLIAMISIAVTLIGKAVSQIVF